MTTKTHYSRIFAAFFTVIVALTTSAFGRDAMALQIVTSPSQPIPVELTLEGLDALDQQSFETTTIWTEGTVTFSGVSLRALLKHLNVEGAAIELVALNDYAITIPISDLEDEVPIIATRMNGKTMSVRDKGPYWLVYPYDADRKYRTETVYSRSIWQLNRLKLLENE